LKARYLELKEDSSPWPTDFSGAQTVKLRVPKDQPLPPSQPPSTPDVLAAEAYLEPSQIQDLADQIPEITRAAAGQDLKYHVRIELKGEDQTKDETAKQINQLLRDVSDKLQL
jgi:hypothetical protein